ncbi:cytoplasmic protein [Candidatus Shapirobacteria bacterium CG09_land_8_20_14_0_10_49_15]|uniref:Cytoplasmic protein n=2 Tax=Candidatus Shapironibacteriota TaxID=1752721 RepID=A0A2M8L7X6_9BACT|nr:MAG: cytoplasmic protein [Candidatus Shapirobacteria bacterium CG09_land_8_20_14_0_10_49_15]PJE70302.1 MAG: cytoplasmic protein [Candidatus Shapirobacteria bacterium CG10_big_fil_rev_8_21_14_0_10_48_15]
MPGFDQTGPAGIGPQTGRGFGPCGFGLGWRRHFGPGRGMGRYFGWRWPQTDEEKKQSLGEYKKALQEELEDVEKELK